MHEPEHASYHSLFVRCLGLMSGSLLIVSSPVGQAIEPLPAERMTALADFDGFSTLASDFSSLGSAPSRPAPALGELDELQEQGSNSTATDPLDRFELTDDSLSREAMPSSLEGYANLPEYLPRLSDTLLDPLNFSAFPTHNRSSKGRFRIGSIPLEIGLSAGLGFNDLERDNPAAAASGISSRYLSTLGQDNGNGFEATLGGSIGFSFGGLNKLNLRGSYEIGYRHPFEEDEAASSGEETKDIDHRFSMVAGWPVGRMQMRASAYFSRSNGPNRDAGGDAEQTNLSLSAGFNRPLGAKTSLDFDVNVPFEENEGGFENRSLSATGFLNYTVNSKWNVSLGGTGGVEKSSGSEEQTYQHALVRWNYTASPRLSFSARGGWEFRQLETTDEAEPIFYLSANWTPRVGTDFSLSAERSVENSSTMESANFVTTSVSLSLLQRLGSRMSLSLSGSYENAVYGSAEDGSSLGRTDNLFSASLNLQAPLGQRCEASFGYSHAFNDSETDGFRSSRAQFSLNLQF